MENKEKSQYDALVKAIRDAARLAHINDEDDPIRLADDLQSLAMGYRDDYNESRGMLAKACADLAEANARISKERSSREIAQAAADGNHEVAKRANALSEKAIKAAIELREYAVALEAALVHVTDVDDYQPHSCEECAQIKALLQGIYEKRLKGATTNTEYQMKPSLVDPIPTSWLDPLLSEMGLGPFSCQDVERLLRRIRERVAGNARHEICAVPLPAEPTEAMLDAGREAMFVDLKRKDGLTIARKGYKAMLAAAPQCVHGVWHPQIAAMVDRFLGWPMPTDFAPDDGIAFTPPTHPNSWPVGTNLFTADQARAMFEYVLAPAPKVADWRPLCPHCERGTCVVHSQGATLPLEHRGANCLVHGCQRTPKCGPADRCVCPDAVNAQNCSQEPKA